MPGWFVGGLSGAPGAVGGLLRALHGRNVWHFCQVIADALDAAMTYGAAPKSSGRPSGQVRRVGEPRRNVAPEDREGQDARTGTGAGTARCAGVWTTHGTEFHLDEEVPPHASTVLSGTGASTAPRRGCGAP